MNKKRIFITPKNDGEAVTIAEILERSGEEHLITRQGWGASWGRLETEIFEELSERDALQMTKEEHGKLLEIDDLINKLNQRISELQSSYYSMPDGEEKTNIEMQIGNLKEMLAVAVTRRIELAESLLGTIDPDKVDVYGIELQGNAGGARNIDHHAYGEDDRRNPKASIEQVADIIEVPLSIEEQFVAANDKGFIPEMEKLGAENGLTGQDLEAIIQNVRMKDRMAQGITLEQEAQAKAAIEQLGNLEGRREFIVDLPHSKTATVCDRMYGKYDELLIISGDGETNFFGSAPIIQMLDDRFPGGWKGGQLEQGSGFWGGYADQKAIRKAVQEKFDKKRLDKGL